MFDANHAMDLVVSLIERGRYQDAVSIGKQAISQHPHDGRLFEVTGVAYFGWGKIMKSMSQLETATTLKPLSSIAQLTLAKCYLKTGMDESASTIVTHLVKQCIDGIFEPAGFPALVHCLAQMRRYLDAALVCECWTIQEPDNGHAHYGIAWYRAMGGEELIHHIQRLEKAVELLPNNVDYRITLGFAYADSSNIPRALGLFHEMTCEQIGCVGCPGCLGEIIDFLCRYESADSITVTRLQNQLVKIQNTLRKDQDKFENGSF
ncbi:MAG: hypothetical protein AAF939_11065 [Planctomycetota bacterium]